MFSADSPIVPLERLQVDDGLLLTAERWQLAHNYHRQRQNIHYQALYQPGIVYGLGVRLLSSPPAEIDEQSNGSYRDRRWLEIQPGLAIDKFGNPIIVSRPVFYHLAASPTLAPLEIYLVIHYVDPDQKVNVDATQPLNDRVNVDATQPLNDRVIEQFEIKEKVDLPEPAEIELCRIRLQPGEVVLSVAADVFNPDVNQLDLRHRLTVQPQPQQHIQIGYLQTDSPDSDPIGPVLTGLLKALPGLYSPLSGAIQAIQPPALAAPGFNSDLLVLTQSQLLNLPAPAREALGRFWATGGQLLVEMPLASDDLAKSLSMQYDLQRGLMLLQQKQKLQPDDETLAELRQEFESELQATNQTIAQQFDQLAQPIRQFLQTAGILLTGDGQLGADHPLRGQPFQFNGFPRVNQRIIPVLNWQGLTLILGQLSMAWSTDATVALPREEVRSAQEFGVNLLHWVGWRRRLMKLQASPAPNSGSIGGSIG